MTGQLKVVDGLAGGCRVAFDAEAQDTSIGIRPQQFISQIMRWMRLQAEIRDPSNLGMFLQPLRQGKCIVRMPLPPQTESLQALQEKEGAKGVKAGPNVAQNFRADFDCECNCTESLAVFHAVVALTWFGESWELSTAGPVELAYRPNDAECQGILYFENLPESTMTPPIVVPCPPIHFVALWTMISAPCLMGCTR